MGTSLGDAGSDGEDLGRQVDAIQRECAQLAPGGAGDHGKPDQHAPVEIGPRFGRDSRGLFGGWGLGLGSGGRQQFGLLEGVHAEPVPADRALAGAGQDGVDLAERAVGEWRALVGRATLVALMLAFGAMLDELAATTAGAAGAKHLVKESSTSPLILPT